MAKQIGGLLEDGYDPDAIRRGVAQWMTKDLAPSVLPSIVNSLVNGSRASPGRSTAGDRVTDALEAGRLVQAELDRKEITR
jgi:hypothetical protein